MNTADYRVPTATITEQPDGFELKIQLPGIGKEEAELHMDGRTLTLKTNAKYQNPAGFKQVVSEFERENYAMSVDLPELADPAALTAKLENGILTVNVKKRPETQARKISIL